MIGGNGAGKSTLLNMIAGVYPLDSGVIELDGTDISRLSESQRAKYLGRVFQDPMRGTAADMQIAENLALAKRRGQRRGLSWGVTKAEKDEYVKLLKRLDLGLDTRLNAKVGLLSGGQRQALTLLMATLTKPRLLLLDEHTAALDPKTASKVLNLTEEIVDENHLTTLMVTHNMNDAIRLGNRLIMMHEGHVIYDVAGDEKKSLTVAADFTYQPWKNVKYRLIEGFDQPGANRFDNYWKAGVGVQYQPAARGSYLRRVNYRLGGYYSNDYVMVGSNSIREYGLSVGLGRPAPSSKTMVNLSFEYRHRAASPQKLVVENYWQLTLGFNINELWFWQNKLR